MSRGEAEEVAIEALTFLAGEPRRLARFLEASGLTVGELRARTSDTTLLVGVLEHLREDESALMVHAANCGRPAEDLEMAVHVLSGAMRER